MKYQRLVEAFFSSNWAILPEKYEAIRALIELRSAGGQVSEEEIAIFRAASRPSPRTAGNVAVIPIYGTISYRANMLSEFSGGTSVQQLTKTFRQALADESIKAIIFDVDSPGGEVSGVQELADEIYAARGQKKTVAVANALAASAAYWLASSAAELVVTPSGQVGSIGVFTAHLDKSKLNEGVGIGVTYIFAGKYKTEANPDQPLSGDAQAAIQDTVNSYYDAFVNSIARNRGVAADDVRNGMGEGRVVVAAQAKKLKMVDRIATLDQTLSRFGVSSQVKPMGAISDLNQVEASTGAEDDEGCMCSCAKCQADDCDDCMNPECEDPICKDGGCPNQAKARSTAPAMPLNLRRRKQQMAERQLV
jgi:signal peptide peptidase SppA